jgi:DNA-binding beta-propeller fold protein YncE
MKNKSMFLSLLTLSLALIPFARAAETKEQPVTLLSITYLPDVVGDFDHFTVDLKRNHLFVSAEVHQSIEVFDLKTGQHLKSIGGFKTPHSIAYAPEKDELMVADGGDSSLVLLSGEDFHHIDRIQLVDGSATGKGDSPDAAYYDTANRLYYIGNGGVSAKLPDSVISIFSVDQGKLIGSIPIPGNNVESMGVDDLHQRLYVNIRDKKEIGVVDLTTRSITDIWTTPDMNANTALAVDPQNERVFVAGRKPGVFYVFNREGKVVSQRSCVNINDDMTWDPILKRIYISGTQGLSIFHQDTPDTYSELANIPTNGGKTSYYVPQVHRFFVIHPKTDVDIAGLLVYRVNQ